MDHKQICKEAFEDGQILNIVYHCPDNRDRRDQRYYLKVKVMGWDNPTHLWVYILEREDISATGGYWKPSKRSSIRSTWMSVCRGTQQYRVHCNRFWKYENIHSITKNTDPVSEV
jgi:hypothetical protein